MDKVTVYVGTVVSGSSGQTNDNRRPVEFEAEELATRTEYGTGRGGGITDTRGVTETLYRAADGRLIVHVDDWSRWQGEPNTKSLHQITEADLLPGGQFEDLGQETDEYTRPLTLDEALQERHRCNGCGAELPAGTVPYHVDADHESWLCEDCADPGEV